MASPNISVTLPGIDLATPLIGASGVFGYGDELLSVCDLAEYGAISTKGLSLEPKAGNKPPRIWETDGGLMNAIGLQNIGLRRFVEEKLPIYRGGFPTKIVVNFFGESPAQYAEIAGELSRYPEIAALEMNISCPNVEKGGIQYGQDPRLAAEVVAATKKAATKPVIVKLSPNVTDIAAMAVAVEGAGADMISIVNTFKALAIDVMTRRPRLSNVTGGLSGPAIKPIALRMVREVACAVKVPVIGMGGIMTGADALEFIIAGASAVQIGTGMLSEFGIAGRINREIKLLLEKMGETDIARLVNTMNT